MNDEQSSEFGNQATPASSGTVETPVHKEWSELQRDLDTLGNQLAQLRGHTAALGAELVASLEARYQEVKSRAMRFKQATEQQVERAREAALQQAGEAQGSLSEATTRSTEAAREAARQMWQKSEPLRQGARDVGEGLGRAWAELRASFGKAAGRLQPTSSAPNGPAPTTSDEPRETPKP
jgi:hypothetical protein